MRSASADLPPEAVNRIRDAAIELFAERGVAATSVRAIAAGAGVSAALVIHHFGSKNALRVVCDQYLAAVVRARKELAPGMDPLADLGLAADGPPLLRYLAKTLVDGSPAVAALVDELVDDAESYLARGVASGALTATEHPRDRAVVLTLWSLGALTLRDHANRLLGVELAGDPTELRRYALPAAELLTTGVLSADIHEQIRAAYPEPT